MISLIDISQYLTRAPRWRTLALLLSAVAERRLHSSRGSIFGLYGQVDAPTSGGKAVESLWARAA